MRKSKTYAAVTALALASAAHAGWVEGLLLTQVGSGDAGGEYTWFTATSTAGNPAGCSSADLYIVRTLPKNALSILLTARASGLPVRAFVHATVCDAYTGRPLVTEVALQ